MESDYAIPNATSVAFFEATQDGREHGSVERLQSIEGCKPERPKKALA